MAATNEIITKIHEFITKAETSDKIILTLEESKFKLIKLETDLWDYKRELSDGKIPLAELIRDILAFYNSYGGYLIFGVNDDGEVVGSTKIIDQQTIRQSIKTYTGDSIPVIINYVQISADISEKFITIVFIPKRPQVISPATIQKQGPELQGNRPLFKPGDIFLRSMDNTTSIRGSEDVKFLLSSRYHPYADLQRILEQQKIFITSSNLPDRSLIFTQFFGRNDIKEKLWSWLVDPRSKYKIIAGPGGVGKTSAAYSFCEEICNESPLLLSKIIWISAKKEQFLGIENNKIMMPYKAGSRNNGEFFSNYDEMLDAISYHFPIIDDEWQDTDCSYKSTILHESLQVFPTLIIIDDLDSLSTDDQRSAITFAIGMPQSKSKVLFTTRKNYIAPLIAVLEMEGLIDDDFHDYVNHLQEIYKRKLSASEQLSLQKLTGGSPLFIDSVFRLLLVGVKFSDAMSRWKESDGEAARAACFRKELEQLTFNAKRILFSISLFGVDGAALSEIKYVTEAEQPEVESAITELGRLFLLKSKQIGNESRFEVNGTLTLILQDIKQQLIPNHVELSKRVHLLRKSGNEGKSRGRSQNIGLLIRLATTMLGQGQAESAAGIIKNGLQSHEDSADLWMVYGRCLSAYSSVDVGKTRKAFDNSFKNGKREPQLFIKWIDFELNHGNSNAAVDVAEKGTRHITTPTEEWISKVGAAYYNRGIERSSRSETIDALSDFNTASTILNSAIKKSHRSSKHNLILISQRINDSIWNTINNSIAIGHSAKYEIIKNSILKGDIRDIQIQRAIILIQEATKDRNFAKNQTDIINSWVYFIKEYLQNKLHTDLLTSVELTLQRFSPYK